MSLLEEAYRINLGKRIITKQAPRTYDLDLLKDLHKRVSVKPTPLCTVSCV